MRKLAVVLAVMVVWAASGCHSTKSRPSSQPSRRVSTNPTDPFFSISYSRDEIGRPDERQAPEPDAIDRLFPQGGPIGDIMTRNTTNPLPQERAEPYPATPEPRRRASVPRGQGQASPAPIAQVEAPIPSRLQRPDPIM